jgi:hypothetical protein
MQVSSWIVHEKMDFDIFNERPVYKVMNPLSKSLLNEKYSLRLQHFLQFNQI